MKTTRVCIAAVVLVRRLGCGCKATSDSGLKKGKAVNKLEYPVQVAPLELRQVNYTVMAPGSIEAFQQVQITARVAGAVDKVGFVEGQDGQAGRPARRHRARPLPGGRRPGEGGARPAPWRPRSRPRRSSPAASRRSRSTRASSPARRSRRTRRTLPRARPTSRPRSRRCASPSSTCATRTCALRSPASSSRAPSRPASTCSQGRSWRRCCSATRSSCASASPSRTRPRLKAGMIANITMRESTRTYSAKIILVADSADPTTRLVPVTAEVDDTAHKYWLRPGAFCEVNVPIGDAQAGHRRAVDLRAADGDRERRLTRSTTRTSPTFASSSSACTRPTAGSRSRRASAPASCSSCEGFEALSEGRPVKITDAHDARRPRRPRPSPTRAPARPPSPATPALPAADVASATRRRSRPAALQEPPK